MIITRNGKIIAIEKSLLQSLDTTLEEISSIVNSLELQISSLTDKPINIKNKTLKIHENEVLSIEDIKVFNTELIHSQETITSQESITPIEPIQTLDTIQPHEIKPQEPALNITPKIEIEPIEIQENKIDLSVSEELKYNTPEFINLEETSLKKEEESAQPINLAESFEHIEPVKTEETQEEHNIKPLEEEVISISFEDDLSEIENILNLPPDEAVKNIESELKYASDELNIDLDTLHELKNELFEMFKSEKSKLINAIMDSNYDEIHKIAHKLKGAALNLRLSNIALILKKIDELSKEKQDLHKIKYLTEKFYDFIERIENNKPKPKIPKEIKNLILMTIQNYLETQNEKQFKKDKKYIEKLLNVKINSIEDLQNIIKED